MQLIIPAILMDKGRTVLTIKGEKGTEEMYRKICDDPAKLIPLLRRENSKCIHLHIFNEKTGIPFPPDFNEIKKYPKLTDIAISLFCRLKSAMECISVLSAGYYRIFLQDLVLTNPTEVKKLVSNFTSSRICGFADYCSGKINFPIAGKSLPLDEAMQNFINCGITRIMFHENEQSRKSQVSLAIIVAYIYKKFGIKTTAFDKIDSYRILQRLNGFPFFGVDSIVFTDSFYHNHFPCQKLWRLCEAELEPAFLEK